MPSTNDRQKKTQVVQPTPKVQTKPTQAGLEQLGPEAQAVLDLQQKVGNQATTQALPYQRDLERSLGRDLSGVQVQTGVTDLMQQGAAAATVGNTVLFAERQPAKEVVAHEAAHVLQNRNSTHKDPARSLAPEGGNAESEADRVGAAAAQGQAARVTGTSGGAVAHWNPFKKLFGKKKPKISAPTGGGKMSATQQGTTPSMNQIIDMEEKRKRAQDVQSINQFEGQTLPEVGGSNTTDFKALGDESGASGSYWAMEGDQKKGIFKPMGQELDVSNEGGYKKGGGAIREVLGYDLSQKLGANVPKTRMMGANSTEFTKINEGKDPEDHTDSSRTQIGSYQELAPNVGSLKEVIENKDNVHSKMTTDNPYDFDEDSLQKMAMMDIMTLNTDRHAGNILVDKDGKLIPIDHGQMMPGLGMGAGKLGSMFGGDTFQAWGGLKTANKGFTKENKDLIGGIKTKELISDLKAKTEARAQAAGMEDSTITDTDWQTMELSTSTLKKAVRAGLTPHQISLMYTRGSKLSKSQEETFEQNNPGRIAPEGKMGSIAQYLRSIRSNDVDKDEFKSGWKQAEQEGIKSMLGEEKYEKFQKSEKERKLQKQMAKSPLIEKARQNQTEDPGEEMFTDEDWGDKDDEKDNSSPMDYAQLLELIGENK